MKEYWTNLSPRERRMLVIMGGVLLLVLLHQAIWEPIVGGADSLRTQVSRQQTEIQWMRESVQTIRQMQGSGQMRPLGGSLLSVIESTSRQQRLSSTIQKVQPEGEKNVRLNLQGIGFDELLSWLDILVAQYGIRVADFAVERHADPGRVNARLLLESM